MDALRLVLVTRRFWPLVGGAERVMANLAAQMASRGADVTLLTARWQPDWPAEITYRGVPVVRLANPNARFWGTIRYMQALGRWLRRNEGRYDLVYISMLKHDAYAALTAVEAKVPVVLRAEGSGPPGDCMWQLDATCGRRIKRRCMKAAALIGPSPAIARELTAAGYPDQRVHFVPNCVPIPEKATPATKAGARAALAAIQPAISGSAATPLAVYAGRLDEAKGLAELVAAWKTLVASRPDAQLLLAGEGPYRETLQQQIDAANLAGRVILAGVFDSVDELLAAADLFVLPSRAEGMSVALLEAMAAGLPIVATGVPGNRNLLEDDSSGLLVPVEDPNAISAAIGRLLDDPHLAARLGGAAREGVVQQFSAEKIADRHLQLFESLLHHKSSCNAP